MTFPTLLRFAAAALLLQVGAAAQAVTRDPLPVPDVAPYRTLKCDFHMHTVISDGSVWPTARVLEAWRDGLDAISITDHTHYNPNKADVTSDLTRPYAIASRDANTLGVILIPGVEFAEGNLHANALFIKDPNALRGLNLADSFRKAHEQGAFVFWNHPGWKERAQWWEPIAKAHAAGYFQGIEVANGLDYYRESFLWVGEKNLAPFANSDVHPPISVVYGRRERPVTLVFARTADAEGIREALFAHRTAAWMGGQIWGSDAFLKGLWRHGVRVPTQTITSRGAVLAIDNRTAIRFRVAVAKSPAWLRVRVSDLAEERITLWRMEIAKTAPTGETKAEVELEITNLHPVVDQNLKVTLPLTFALK